MGRKDVEFSLQCIEFEMSVIHLSVDNSFEERRTYILRIGRVIDEESMVRILKMMWAQIKSVNLNFQ